MPEDQPVYRSLGTTKGAAPPSIKLGELKVFHNPDGGVVAMVPVHPYVKRGMTAQERADLGPEMLKCILDGLASAGVDPKRVFGDEYDEDRHVLGFLSAVDACTRAPTSSSASPRKGRRRVGSHSST